MRGFPQNRQIGIALPLAVMNRIRRQAVSARYGRTAVLASKSPLPHNCLNSD